ncbi:MAG TPA: class I SAM-dependent methyltransferase [Pyrinomonadaceae bacterium]|nr:class I SAM-dependent methyltransferase [Pyrinomonadaceae bacterium]
MDALDERARLLLLTEALGTGFGTEDLSLFLYSLVRMHTPETIVDLGTGFGISAFWMALAAKKNQMGHVWTVDDFELFDKKKSAVEENIAGLRKSNIIALGDDPTAEEYYSQISSLFALDPYLTFIKSKIDLNEVGHFNEYPFAGRPIDLLFSDFKHGGLSILELLGHFLPCMAVSSSIFIHSAPTSWSSYLLLEQLSSQFNAGKVPKLLQDFCSLDLGEFVQRRRIILVHLTERKNRRQNSAAWLKIEPVDVLPHPRSTMRGMTNA